MHNSINFVQKFVQVSLKKYIFLKSENSPNIFHTVIITKDVKIRDAKITCWDSGNFSITQNVALTKPYEKLKTNVHVKMEE